MLQASLLIELMVPQLVKVKLDSIDLLRKGRDLQIHLPKVPLFEVLEHVEHALGLGLKKHLLVVFEVLMDLLHQLLQGGLVLILLREAKIFRDPMDPSGKLMITESLDLLKVKSETLEIFDLRMILQLTL